MYCVSSYTIGTMPSPSTAVDNPLVATKMMPEEATAITTTATMTTIPQELITTTSSTTTSTIETVPDASMTHSNVHITITPTTRMEPVSSSKTAFRFLRPQENPYILQVSPNQQLITLNCTAFYNGSNDSITIKWRRNDRVIFNDTEEYREMNIVSTILKIDGRSLGRYTCTFIHSLEESVRELQIISSGKNTY